MAKTRKIPNKQTADEPKSNWPFKTLPDKDFYRPDEYEKHFSLGKNTAYGHFKRGIIFAERVGNSLRIPRSEMLRMAGKSTEI